MENYYEILNVRPTADVGEIRIAFKKLAIQFHPDKMRGNNEGDQEEAHRMMSLINEAYRTLIDPEKKKDYDVWMGARTRAVTKTPRSMPTPPASKREADWLGTMEWQKPEEIQEREQKKREQVMSNIESLILSRVDELNWQPIELPGWDRSYQGAQFLKKYRLALRVLPEITNASLAEIQESMSKAKGGLGGLLGPTTIYIVCFHEVIDHAGIYDLFVDLNRDRSRRYLALVNLRFRRIDPPQVPIRDKLLQRTMACIWVNLE
ncbi:MAG: DnaJ domain-containing protein [Planctomycetota bacterium]|nr:DnaJ domain-containing protein [Planctomycetota bacterium]